MNAEVVKTIHLSYTAPDLPTPMVKRPHLVSAILQLFDSSIDMVCVEGRPGYGKTILLREFSESCDAPCFSVFIRAGSRHSYDPLLARADLANQLFWHLESRRINDDNDLSELELRALLSRCTRNLTRRNATAYFIIDGLHNIPPEDDPLLQAIMSLFPFGTKPFRFLFSTDSATDIFRHNKTLKAKPFVLMGFNSYESDEFLSDVIPDKSLRIDYHTLSVGCRHYSLAPGANFFPNPINQSLTRFLFHPI